MDFPAILGMVITIVCAVAIAFMFYFRVRGNVFAAVSELIAAAEMTGCTGVEKMRQVVAGLAQMVPAVMRTILTDERLEEIAQWIFDWMRRYADAYRKAIGSLGEQADNSKTAETIGKTAAAELIAELYNLTLAALREKATEYGVDCTGLGTKKEVIEAIALAILNKA